MQLHFFWLIIRLFLSLEVGGLIQTRTPKRLDFFPQFINRFLIFTEHLFKLKASINVTYPSDQDSQKDRTKDDQEERERDFWNFKPLIILPWKNEAEGDLASILNKKGDRQTKGRYPKQCLDPSHFIILLS
jgi:hypothetical protein